MTLARRPFLPVMVAAAVLAGCKGAPTSTHPVTHATPAPTPVESVRIAASAAPSLVPVPVAVPVAAATLSGTVKAPTRFISDAGSGVISNNGGSFISDAGSGYRLLETAEAPVPGARVALLDAAGKPVPGPDGTPLVAVTDATGAYRFTAPLPPGNLIVSVALANNHGSLQAIAATRTVDIGLVSTLTTGYILDQYVKGQPDPVKTLAKLPAAVEADTRAKAAAALTAVPDDLTPAKVVAAVESLRKADKTFDAQMETVKKLLIAAGQSNQGSGLPGVQVYLGAVTAVLPQPDGGAYIGTVEHLWHLDAQGKVEIVNGGAIAAVGPMSADAAGRPVLSLPQGKVARLEADGQLTPYNLAGFQNDRWYAYVAGPAGVFALQTPVDYVVIGDDPSAQLASDAAVLWELSTTAPPAIRHTFTLAETNAIGTLVGVAQDANGGLLIAGSVDRSDRQDSTDADFTNSLLRYDLKAQTLSTLEKHVINSSHSKTFDAAGNIYNVDAVAHTLTTADGTQILAGDPLTANYAFYGVVQVAPTAGGYMLAVGNHVYSVAGGRATLVAGADKDPGTATTKVPLKQVRGLAVGPANELYVSEIDPRDLGRILKLQDGKDPVTLADKLPPATLRLDARGRLYFLTGVNTLDQLLRIEADGKQTIRYTGDATHAAEGRYETLEDFQVGPDGTVYLVTTTALAEDPLTLHHHTELKLMALADGGGTPRLLYDATGDGAQYGTGHYALALDAAGTLYLAGNDPTFLDPPDEDLKGDGTDSVPAGLLRRWKRGGTMEILRTGSVLGQLTGLACTPEGKLYGTDATHVYRLDQAIKPIAGAGTALFGGKGIDDGLDGALAPCLDPGGDLLFGDANHHQIKRIPSTSL
ncbi:MAG: repeat-containing protein [Cyanobacteria bacterium RYN_339]|nr:repeat-containing protein [Cyanobacteria bacterium RYN_339]